MVIAFSSNIRSRPCPRRCDGLINDYISSTRAIHRMVRNEVDEMVEAQSSSPNELCNTPQRIWDRGQNACGGTSLEDARRATTRKLSTNHWRKCIIGAELRKPGVF